MARNNGRTETHKELILFLYEQKEMAVIAIADKVGVTPPTIRAHLRKWGVELKKVRARGTTREVLEENEQYIIDKYSVQRAKLVEIAKEFDTYHSTISKFLKSKGVAINRKGYERAGNLNAKLEANQEKIIRLYTKENKSLKDIAEIIGSDKKDISKFLKSKGVAICRGGYRSRLHKEPEATVKIKGPKVIQLISELDMSEQEAIEAINSYYQQNLLPKRKRLAAMIQIKDLIETSGLSREELEALLK